MVQIPESPGALSVKVTQTIIWKVKAISEGDLTTFTDTQVPVNSSRRFYRVHEMEP